MVPLEYSHGDNWERLLRQGRPLLERFARDNRIRIRQSKQNMQKKLVRAPNGLEFLAYVNAIGALDGTRRLLEMGNHKYSRTNTTAPDLQLVC